MFGLSWGQIAIIVLVGVFVLGPERIPTAVTWVLTNLRKLRSMAAGAQAELRKEIGPELEELRRQVADLQSLKEIQELRDLRDLHPKRLIGKNILGDEFSGGITGFLGLNQPAAGATGGVEPSVGGSSNGGIDSTGAATAAAEAPAAGSALNGGGRSAGSELNGATVLNGGGVLNGRATAAPATPPAPGGPTPPHLPPSMTKLAAPKVVGGVAPRVAAAALPAGERPPFDPDGT